MIKTALLAAFFSLVLCSHSLAQDTPLEVSMKKMSKAYKQLSLDLSAPDDGQKPDYLSLVATIKVEAQNARAQVPKKAADLPPDQQAAMVAAYQKSMDSFIADVDVLAQDIQSSQWPGALQQLGVLKKDMFDGHKAFRKKE